MLRVRQVEVMTVAVPFRITFRHALASRSEGEAIVVRTVDAPVARRWPSAGTGSVWWWTRLVWLDWSRIGARLE